MIDLTVWLRLQNGNFELGALQMLHVHWKSLNIIYDICVS